MEDKWSIDNIDSQSGKIIVITGSNSGVGLETAKILVDKGATVVLACRNKLLGEQTQKELGINSHFIQVDTGIKESMDMFSETLSKKFEKIDLLINNAGVMFNPPSTTKDDLEITFGVNYIGYFYLTLKLINMIKDVSNSRSITVSSIASYHINKLDWGYFNPKRTFSSFSDKQKIYDHTNLFRLMFALKLDSILRERKSKITSVPCHPGVAKSKLGRHVPLVKFFYHTPFLIPASKGCYPILKASTDIVKGGDFIGFDGKGQWKGNPIVVEPNTLAKDPYLQEKLWNKSLEITGINF